VKIAFTSRSGVRSRLRVRGRRSARRMALVVRRAVLVVALLVAVVAYQGAAAQRAATAGERALRGAQSALRDGRLDESRSKLMQARRAFGRARWHTRLPRALTAVTPDIALLDDHAAAIDTLARAGVDVTASARRIVDSARLPGPAKHGRNSQVLEGLQRAQQVLAAERRVIERARGEVVHLRQRRLVGPVAGAARTARRRLNAAGAQLDAAARGLDALRTFLGARGSRRYLVLSQNPDEPRPTGGFIGTYGVLVAREGRLSLQRYGSIESWYRKRPNAVVPRPAPLVHSRC
jgi:hypothetical protein